LRALAPDDLAVRILPFLQRAGLVGAEPTDHQLRLLLAAAPLVQERMTVLEESVGMLGFLVVDPAEFVLDAEAVASLGEDGAQTVAAAYDALVPLADWTTAGIEAALRNALVEGLGLKPKLAFTPVRVAVTGRRVSPPLFESIELLGRDESLARLARFPR